MSEPRPKTSIKIKSVGAVPKDAQERVVSLVVDNNSLERPASGEEGGHGNGPQKGPLDGLAYEQPSRPSRQEGEYVRSIETQEPSTAFGPDLVAAVDTGLGSTGEGIELNERTGSKIKRLQSPIVSTIDDHVPISIHYKHHPEGFNGAALELQSTGDNSDARSKRSRKTLENDNDDDDDDDEQPARRTCAVHRHRVSCSHVARAHTEPPCRRSVNRSRPCRVHDRRRDCSRGKSTERPEHRHLRFHDPENVIVRLEQDPILRPVRILGCPPAEGQEVSSYLEPAGPSYVYTGIGVSQFAGGELHCFDLHNPDNILPKSRVGSIARLLDGPNRAVKDINRKVLAMARAMTPAWSLRLLGVSCGSVLCAWGLLLILSVLGGGASHGTGIGSFGLGSMTGTMDDLNSVRCPWACTCGGQEVDCSHRELTQIPGDLASLLIAEKL
ncbi:Uncharacterized protein DBV15_06748 [Temnothorax longispinosus]|uniref:LRRNT domain-containing protein n=1 Tax=Temnothorax longispinosus TaxID=300112 RepID=A0A4S2JQD0_9HYME|nr:Uncharacterized protein DBV15_06748 [Temnothorax longispinosus]